MRTFMKNILILQYFLLLIIQSHAFADDMDLIIDIKLNKENYFLLEPIWVEVILKNNGSDSLKLKSICPECLDNSLLIEVTDSVGNKIKYTGPVFHLPSDYNSSFYLYQDERYNYIFNVLEYFSVNKKSLIEAWYLKYLPEGSYLINISQNGYKSNQIQFNVTKPFGETKQEYNDLNQAYLSSKDSKLENLEENLKSFIKKHPNSIYIEKAYFDLPDDTTFLSKFPDSYYSYSILKTLTANMSVKNKVDFLNRILNEHQNTKSSEFAQQMLKSINIKREK